MSIHLVGGGRPSDPAETAGLYVQFVGEAAARAAGSGRLVPRIGVLAVVAEDETGADVVARWTAQLARAGASDPVVTAIAEGEQFDSSQLSLIDGLLVAGGLTPAYLEAVTPVIDEIRLLVGDGLPYLGFSAGAMIAAEQAILGGWLIDGVPVCDHEVAEGLDEVTVLPGLGLVDVSIDVHAAQWGTLARIIAATEAGLVSAGVAIDEHTALIVGEDEFVVAGRGSVWQIDADDESVAVSRLTA